MLRDKLDIKLPMLSLCYCGQKTLTKSTGLISTLSEWYYVPIMKNRMVIIQNLFSDQGESGVNVS